MTRIEDPLIVKNYNAIIDVIIKQGDNTPLDQGYLSIHGEKQQFKLFTFQPEDAVALSTFTLIKDDTIRIMVQIADKYSDQTMKLKVLGDKSKDTSQFKIDSSV